MNPLLPIAFLVGLIIAARQGYNLGRKDGRHAERLQVIAFLVGAFRHESREQPEALAKRIDDGEHLRWNLRQKPQGPGAA